MQLPFSTEEFLAVFRAYNLGVWPAQIALYLLAIILVFISVSGLRWHHWGVVIGLAVLWAWMGVVYHLVFFAEINPAARAFGVLFIAQALLWIFWARRYPLISFKPTERRRLVIGAGLLTYALLVYPLLNFLLGHGYPNMPTFGLPCPTTVATFGFLTWATPRPPWVVWIIPILWSVVGTSAAFTLGIHEDLGLLAAMIFAVVAHLGSKRETAPP